MKGETGSGPFAASPSHSQPTQPDSEEGPSVKPSAKMIRVSLHFTNLTQTYPTSQPNKSCYSPARHWAGNQLLTGKSLLTTEPRPLSWLSPFPPHHPHVALFISHTGLHPFSTLSGHFTSDLTPVLPLGLPSNNQEATYTLRLE